MKEAQFWQSISSCFCVWKLKQVIFPPPAQEVVINDEKKRKLEWQESIRKGSKDNGGWTVEPHFFEVEVVEVATQFRWNSFNVPNRKFATWKADRILTLAFNLSSKISSRCLINYIQQPFGHPEFCIANLVPLDLWSFWIKDSPRSRSFQQWETPVVFMPWSPCWYTEWFGESRADITKIH